MGDDGTATAPAGTLARTAVVRVPVVLQMEAAECGAAALTAVLAHHGCHRTLEELRRTCGVSRDGSNALQIAEAARHYGMEADGLSAELDELAAVRMPAILHWGFNHFLVLEGFDGTSWHLMDPSLGRRAVSTEDFRRDFTGVCIEIAPGGRFEPSGQPSSPWPALRASLRGSGPAIAVALIAGVLMSIPGIAVPVLGSIFVDGVLARGQSGWIMPIVGFALMAVVAKAVLSTVQAAVLIRLERRMCMTSSARFMEHALRLPVDFYSHRLPGEMVSRLGGIERLSQLLGSKLFPALAGAATGVLYLVAMISIDLRLALLSVLVASMIAFIIARSARTLRDQSRIAEQETGRQAGIVAVGLQAMETLKASGRESDFLARVMGAQARARRSRQELEQRGLAVESVPPFLESLLSQAIVLAFGAAMVMQGELTLGGLLAFQTILYFFMGPVVDLAGFAQEFQSVHADLSRLDDVQRHPGDPLAAPGTEAGAARLEGCVELREVTFGYAESQPPLLSSFSMRAEPGRRIALVGTTGSGKSTVAKLVTGLYRPWTGTVELDGRELSAWPRIERTGGVAMVAQQPQLFEGSLRENLTLWDADIPEPWLYEALEDAASADLLLRRGGLGQRVEEAGSNFSGGEAQRIEIARALARRPSVLVLDEATSALDAETEFRIDRALRRRGCTCIIVAHRLSTVRDADEIIVLDRGEVLERGTHQELMAAGGAYAALVEGGSL
jgi:NHLM bacteriocin system ABC transporter peptidase/ATP-binding protein